MAPAINDCPFCDIARKAVEAVLVFEDDDVLAFLDRCPIREAHCQIITKQHFETFEQLPSPLAGKVVEIGQRLARRLKEIYGVERVGFLFSGGDVPHVHAHVIPLHEKTDITSARYIIEPQAATFSSDHLVKSKETLEAVQKKLGFGLL